ncbi:hypothetical protein SO802_020761 [Lithocarpus litseifolius]|uniref:Uncharacterized protein n=1 Tax=Lithocarpus litseifolius TaxID=425828 RepID=A0AAW2CI24_9ROSI
MKPDIQAKMTISFGTLNGGFKAEQSEDRAKKSIKEFHLAQETKTVILCCMERRAWNSKSANMSPLARRGVILLVCIGLLALQPEEVSGLRSIDLALKLDKVQSPFLKHLRVLKVVAVDDFHTKLNLAPAPSVMVDPNQSNKRRVRKGSDPIHNRC